MLHKADTLGKCKLIAVDREIGKIRDLYFDDRFWTVRYLVADTGGWLTGRLVLISPFSVNLVDAEEEMIGTTLTAKQIEESPSPEADKPVSRQFESVYADYYGYPYYWYGPGAWGAYPRPSLMHPKEMVEQEESWDSHLRSADEVQDYEVGALDHHIGHISDFIVDDESWTIRYLVVDTRNWWPGKHVLLSPGWATAVDWATRTVAVDLTRDAIKQAPEYDEDKPITRDYEIELFRHYSKQDYWSA